ELTGLVNRLRFIDIITGQLSYAKTPEQACILLLINIDEFKYVNETYGHNIGDEFLKGVAGLLENIFSDIDAKYIEKAERKSIVGRLGGDEFAVFMPHGNKKDALDAALQIQERMKELYNFISMPVHMTASMGLAIYPEHGTTTKELLTKANAAMFHAKKAGKGKYHIYTLEDNDIEKLHTRFEWMGRIQRAIEEDRFTPWFQPILDLKHNKISHYEALARMRDEDGNILLPAVFIETAERFGLIGTIDKIIIEKTMRLQAETWQQGRHLTFGMNLSGKDLGDEEIMTFLRSKIVETGARPEYLVFEITETAAVRDINKAIKFIRDLKSIGCHFSLDDFGVGFTSFIYLREMDVDYVKIDGAFIKNLHKEYRDQLFVKAISDVAKGMGIKTIAEFVENEEIIKFLKRLGVGYAQGYAIGKPAPWEEIERGYAPDS
ncbi:MAG: GGDEF and EAL domain-containing protein, partial [Deltaproteobacteria bacterium]